MELDLIAEGHEPGSGRVAATSKIRITRPREKPPKGISVSIKKIETKSFVPLGIKNTEKKRDKSSDKIAFTFEIKNKPATGCRVKISNKHPKPGMPSLLWEGRTTEKNIGKHFYEWDGFSRGGKYNSQDISDELIFEITAKSADGDDDTAKKEVTMKRKFEWLDVLITKHPREIYVTLRVKFKDGGARGLELGGNVPQEQRTAGREPLNAGTRTRDFEGLRRLAIEGVNRYWGRNGNNPLAAHVKITDKKYEVFVNTIDEPNSPKKQMKEIELIFNTNGKLMYSRNLGRLAWPLSILVRIFSGRAVYHAGYIQNPNKWVYSSESHADTVFKYLAAHEIGHEILQAFKGTIHSYTHKGTTIFSQKPRKKAPSYPKIKPEEIDIMKEHNGIFEYRHYGMYIATKEDVLNLIWLIKAGIK
jgi:hypothetical protein